MSLGQGNLFWGMQFRTCRKFWERANFSLVLSQNFLQIQKPHRNHFRCDSAQGAESSKKIKLKKLIKSFCYFLLLQKVESTLPLNHNLPNSADSANSQNLGENNRARSAHLESRPLRGAKNRNQASSSASADFLLEAEKRGSPPKSEKAAAFWRVGGAGRGVQPFLRKEKSEIDKNGGKVAESALDSANSQNLQDRLPRRFCESAHNDESFLHSPTKAKSCFLNS